MPAASKPSVPFAATPRPSGTAKGDGGIIGENPDIDVDVEERESSDMRPRSRPAPRIAACGRTSCRTMSNGFLFSEGPLDAGDDAPRGSCRPRTQIDFRRWLKRLRRTDEFDRLQIISQTAARLGMRLKFRRGLRGLTPSPDGGGGGGSGGWRRVGMPWCGSRGQAPAREIDADRDGSGIRDPGPIGGSRSAPAVSRRVAKPEKKLVEHLRGRSALSLELHALPSSLRGA